MSLDRALQVGGVVIGLVGGGFAVAYPTKWAAWSLVGVGLLVLFGATVWAIASRHAVNEYKAEHHSFRYVVRADALPQDAIPARAALQRREIQRQPSVFEATNNSRIEMSGFDARTGHLIREEYEGNEDDLPEYIAILNVALAQFYYRPDRGVEPYLYVSAHIFVYDAEGNPLKPLLYNTAWNNDDYDSSMQFYAGEVHDLILALIRRENPDRIVLYEHKMGKVIYEGYGSEVIMTPKIHEIEGTVFFMKVELTPKVVNDPLPKQMFWFHLTIDEESELTSINPPAFAT